MPDGPGVSYKTETECSGGGRPVQADWFGRTGQEACRTKRLTPRQPYAEHIRPYRQRKPDGTAIPPGYAPTTRETETSEPVLTAPRRWFRRYGCARPGRFPARKSYRRRSARYWRTSGSPRRPVPPVPR